MQKNLVTHILNNNHLITV